jgi:hypothetical protein
MSSDEANDAAFRERLLSDPRLSPVLSDPARFRAQVLLTEVVETSGAGTEACPSRGHTRLRRHAFRADAEYFYPASTVKLFGAIAACVALRELAQAHPGLDKDTPLAFGACPREDASKDETETETENEVTTLRAELAKLFLTSDNRAFNRCFDLCGPSGIRRWTARHMPGEDVRITHRLFDDAGDAGEADAASALPEVWAKPKPRGGGGGWVRIREKRTDACRFEDDAPENDTHSTYRVGSFLYRALENDVVSGGLDCEKRNRCSLRALQRAALILARPDLVGFFERETLKENHETPRIHESHQHKFGCQATSLHPEDRAFLLRCAAAAPRDAAACGVTDAADVRNAEAKPDEYNAFFLPGIQRALRERVAESRSNDPPVSHTYRPVVTNKLGRAYGFSVDNAHVRVDVVRSIDPNGEEKKKNDDDDDDDERASLRFREFFLAVAVETNENGVVNDDAYEYEAVADPFLEAVAEVAAKFAWDPKRRERGE